jgi:hypothetical protein
MSRASHAVVPINAATTGWNTAMGGTGATAATAMTAAGDKAISATNLSLPTIPGGVGRGLDPIFHLSVKPSMNPTPLETKQPMQPVFLQPEDLRNDLGRLGTKLGSIIVQNQGVDKVHDGQIMIRVRFDQYIILDYAQQQYYLDNARKKPSHVYSSQGRNANMLNQKLFKDWYSCGAL